MAEISEVVAIRAALKAKAQAAIAANETFLALASPTPAQIAGQVKALTRQITFLIRRERVDVWACGVEAREELNP